MFTVTYTYFKKYRHEKEFKNYNAARKFFYLMSKTPNVTRTQILSTSTKSPSLTAKIVA